MSLMPQVLDRVRRTINVQQKDLHCKNGCGFYGNPQWQGYCSKCFQTHRDEIPPPKPRIKPLNAVKNLLSSLSSSGSHENIEATPSKIKEWARGRQKWISSEAIPRCEMTCRRVEREGDEDAIPEFFGWLQEKMNNDGTSTDEIKVIAQKFERYVLLRAYPIVFCASDADEEKDHALHKRISQLHWVTAVNLDSPIDSEDADVQNSLAISQAHLVEMGTHRVASDKLNCIVSCASELFNALKLSGDGKSSSADAFLPSLIFLILKTNPPHLASNIDYITRFAWPTDIAEGETGYYFTNLCCAVEFLFEGINAASLRMSEQDFDRLMRGEPSRALIFNDCLRRLATGLETLQQLGDRHSILLQEMKSLQNDVDVFRAQLKSQVSDILIEDLALQQ